MKAFIFCAAQVVFLAAACVAKSFPEQLVIDSGWHLQTVSNVTQSAEIVSQTGFHADGWHPATVPGTVLTVLVNDKIFPEPLYGENNRRITDDFCRQSWWHRTSFIVPKDYAGGKIWLNFDGININYSAEIWVNGKQIGAMRGAFARGIFDVSTNVTPGESTALAVLIAPQPHLGVPHEHTITNGMGRNGGITAIDGPTFLCTLNIIVPPSNPSVKDSRATTQTWQHFGNTQRGRRHWPGLIC